MMIPAITPENLWVFILLAAVPGLLALAAMALSIIFGWGERQAKIDNLDAGTVNKNTDTIKTMQEIAKGLRLRVDNLEAEIGEEKALRRKDKVHFEAALKKLKAQYEGELSDMQKAHEYEMSSLELRVKELEDELSRTEKARIKAQDERDEARKENHSLLEENYKLRQKIATEG